MKAVLMSIRPQHVANILNKIKTLEIRKHFPKDYVGWVYVYATKGKSYLFKDLYAEKSGNGKLYYVDNKEHNSWSQKLNGTVVARFWCDKVEKIKYHFGYYDMGEWAESYILENSCLTAEELDNYLQASKEYDETKVSKVYGCAIHITKLEIFDKPMDIRDFVATKYGKPIWKPVSRPPQSWQYISI